MGSILLVQGADFRANGMPLSQLPVEQDVMPTLQSNALALGQALQYSGGNVIITTSTTRVAVNKTTFEGLYLHLKVKAGFQIALAVWKGTSYASSIEDGTLLANAASWKWITVPQFELTLDLSEYDTVAMNIRYDDNTTAFTDNVLTNYLDYAKVLAY